MPPPRYRKDRLVGTGGMAEVWRAFGPEGVVALKRLLPHAARNPSVVAAFEREGRLLRRIRHPNVIAMHSVVRDDDGPCLVLEFLDGADLRTLCGKPCPLPIALRIGHDILLGLEAVHDVRDDNGRLLGLIHRDLSPANVLVGRGGEVKLSDFGIARALSGTHATTGLNIKGTLAYLSPEQASGMPVDARSDLFSVGALLYEMLSGQPVYRDDDARLALARARAGDVRSLAELCPALPFGVVEVVDRALSAVPSDRFPNAQSMRAELVRLTETHGMASNAELSAWFADVCPADVSAPQSGAGGDERRMATLQGSTTSSDAPGRRPKRWIVGGVLFSALLGAVIFGSARRHSSPALASETNAPAPSAVATTSPASVTPGMADEPPPSPVASVARLNSAAEKTKNLSPSSSERSPNDKKPAVSAPASTKPDKAAKAEPKGQRAILDLGSEPAYAYVTIDGVRVGPTPVFGRELAPGPHRIEVSRQGLGSKTFTLDLHPGERVSRVVKLP